MRIRLTSIIAIMLLLYIALLGVLYAVSEAGYVDFVVVGISTAMAVVLIGGILFSSVDFRPIHVMFSYYMTCKYLLFPLAILYTELNPDFIYLETFQLLSTETIVNLQMFGLFSSMVVVAGFWWAEAIPKKYTLSYKDRSVAILKDASNRGGFFLASLVMLAGGLYIFSKQGFGALSGVESESGANLWNLANTQIPLYLGMVYLAYGYYGGVRGVKLSLICLMFIFVLVGLLQGSRSSFFMTFLHLGLIYMIVKRDPAIRLRVVVKFFVWGGLLSFFAFVIATAAKDFFKYGFLSGNIVGLFRQVADGFVLSIAEIFEKFLFRLADAKAPYYIINDMWVNPPELYLGFGDSVQRIINDFVPGSLFQQDIVSTQLFEWIYFGYLPVYSGETWGLPTVCYLYFGYVIGLCVLLLIAFAFAMLYRLLLPRMIVYAPIAVISIVICFDSIIQGGVPDIWAPQTYHFIFRLFVFIAVWKLMSNFALLKQIIPKLGGQMGSRYS